MTFHAKEQALPGMVRLALWGWLCERCGHEWLPREIDRAPTICPKCKSPYWNVPRKKRASESGGGVW